MPPTPIQLDHSIRRVLTALRRRIRCYVWIQGLAAVVAVTGLVFWISLGVDWFFEPAAWVRKVLLSAAVLGIAAVAYRTIGRRAFAPLTDRSMATLLERRFSQFDGSLLTAVELTDRPPDPNDCSRDMLEATCRQACVPLHGVRLGAIFNPRPLRSAVVWGILLAASTIGFWSLASDAFGVWLRRSVLMSDELWPRRTILTVEGFADGVALVARGGDFTLIAKADTTAQDVPRSVRIEYRPEGSPRLDATMVREGQAVAGRDRYQTYSYTFRGVLAPVTLNLRGGDASIRNLRIEVVDAPTLIQLNAECKFPDYTGRAPRTLPATGVVPVPRGTQVTLRAKSNKRLTRVRIVDGDATQLVADSLTRDLEAILALQQSLPRFASGADLTSDTAERIKQTADRLAQLNEEASRRFAGNGSSQAAREFLDGIAATRSDLNEVLERRSDPGMLESIGGSLRSLLGLLGRLLSFAGFDYSLQPIDETKTLELTLRDVDGIASNQPIRIILSAVEDQPPQASVRLDGIGSAITPQARLPFNGMIHDDHGVDRVWLEYAVEGREPRTQTLKQVTEIATHVPLNETFDVEGLRLAPGQKMLIAVKTQDRCNLDKGPNVGSGDRWMLDVVAPEKLRAMLESREIVLRQRFETIVEDVEGIRETLSTLTFDDEPDQPENRPVEAAEPGESERPDTAERRRGVRLLRIQRARQNGQKDGQEIAGVADAFSDIRKELVNNRIYTEELRIRIEQDIVEPLTRLVLDDLVQLDEELARLETTHDDRRRSPGLRDAAIVRTDAILKTMRAVLARMVELEDFNEAVQLLRSIIEEQEQIRDAVRERRKAKLRQLLED